MENQKKISSMTLALLMFMTVFGITNIANNYGAYGNSAIGWFILLAVYFVPLALMIAELASYNTKSNSGLTGWVKEGTNETWAFIAAWCYFIANIFYLPMLASRIPVFLSWITADFESLEEVVASGGAIDGVITATSNPSAFLAIAFVMVLIAIVCALYFEKIFDKLGTFVGYLSLGITIFFIVMALLTVPVLGHAIANPIVIGGESTQSIMPEINAASLSTFAWILFAIAGIETVGSYVGRIQNPEKKVPRGILLAAAISIGLYIIGFVAMSFILLPEQVPAASMENLLAIMFAQVGSYWGFGPLFLKVVMVIFSLITFTALVLWIVATVSFLFDEFPKGILPEKITAHRTNSIPTFGVVISGILILLFLIISAGASDPDSNIYVTLYDMSTIAVILPYAILSVAYIGFKLRGKVSEYQVSKSKGVSLAIGIFVLVISVMAVVFSTLVIYEGETGNAIDWAWFVFAAGGLAFFISIGLGLYARKKSVALSYGIYTIIFGLASFIFAPEGSTFSPAFLLITLGFFAMFVINTFRKKQTGEI